MDTDKDFALDAAGVCIHCDGTGMEPFETSEYPPEPCSVCGPRSRFDCPPLAPEEHAWIEERVGRKLTTVEAQLALKDAKLAASWEWEAAKKGLQP